MLMRLLILITTVTVCSVNGKPVKPHEGLNKTANVDPESVDPIEIQLNFRRDASKLTHVEPEKVKPVDDNTLNSHKELNKTAKFELKSENPVNLNPIQPKTEANKTDKVEPKSFKSVEVDPVKPKTESNKTAKVEPISKGYKTTWVEPASVDLFLELNPVLPHKEANNTI